jgi:hypothetical protein
MYQSLKSCAAILALLSMNVYADAQTDVPTACLAVMSNLQLERFDSAPRLIEKNGRNFQCGINQDGQRWICKIEQANTCRSRDAQATSDNRFQELYSSWTDALTSCLQSAEIVPIDYRRWESETDVWVTLGKRFSERSIQGSAKSAYVVARLRQRLTEDQVCSTGQLMLEVGNDASFRPFD